MPPIDNIVSGMIRFVAFSALQIFTQKSILSSVSSEIIDNLTCEKHWQLMIGPPLSAKDRPRSFKIIRTKKRPFKRCVFATHWECDGQTHTQTDGLKGHRELRV